MVDYKYKDLYLKGDTERQLQIAFDSGIITNKDLQQGSFQLSESLCSENELRFGCCESSVLKFRVHNVFEPLKGKGLTASEILNGNTDEPFLYGKYKVFSDTPTADRKYRDIEAYDAMYDILMADMTEWYNTVLPDEFAVISLRAFRKAFIEHFGLEEEEITLVNDDVLIDRTIDPESISGKDIITAICELNGCFGNITRTGKFRYVMLNPFGKGLFPSETLYPSDTLYPREPGVDENFTRSKYISCQYEDFVTQKITGIRIRQEENDIGMFVGIDDNVYIVEDNFLVYGKGGKDLQVIGNNLLSQIQNVSYRPIKNLKTAGKPYLEVGDRILVSSTETLIETYILERTIKGLKGAKDTIVSRGEEKYQEQLNSVSKSIIQLKGKTNVLTRTLDETKSRIEDVNAGLSSEITQTASQIRLEITDTQNSLESKITQTAADIRLEVEDVQNKLNASIKINTDAITAEVQRAKEEEGKLSSSITQTAESIRSEVAATYSTKEYTDESIEKVSAGLSDTLEVYSTTAEMNSAIEQKAGEINLTIEAEIKETREYIDVVGATAQSNAIADTAERLKSYSTTTEMQTAISASESGINLSVSKQIEETKKYADSASSTAQSNAIADTAERLKSYSTTTQMESAIDVSERGILSSVSATYETKTNASSERSALSSRIEQTVSDIELSVSNGESSSGISIKLTKEDGTTDSVTGNIEMTGMVTFSDLSIAGATVINGANIVTGSITADKIELPGISMGNDGSVYSIVTTDLNAYYIDVSSINCQNSLTSYLIYGDRIVASEYVSATAVYVVGQLDFSSLSAPSISYLKTTLGL